MNVLDAAGHVNAATIKTKAIVYRAGVRGADENDRGRRGGAAPVGGGVAAVGGGVAAVGGGVAAVGGGVAAVGGGVAAVGGGEAETRETASRVGLLINN